MAKKADIRTGTLVAGIFTALVIVVSQLFYFNATAEIKKELQTEQQCNHSSDTDEAAGHSGDGTYITLPSSTPPSSTHVEFQQHGFCLFEILFEEVKTTDFDCDIALPASKFFLTLFQDIISPNAP